MKSVITPSSLNGMINQQGVKDTGERGELKKRIGSGTAEKQFFKFTYTPNNIPGRIPVIPEPAKPTPELSSKPQKRTPISPVPPVEAQTEMFPEMVSESNVNADEFDLSVMANEDLNAIRNIILDLAEGKSISNLRNYSDGNITNYGIAQKIWEEVPEDLKQNPNDEALKKLFDQNNIPYKAQ
jgi:hypothetical protein